MSIWKKILFTIIFIGFYFLILRPIRSYTAQLIKPAIEVQQIEAYFQSSVSITFTYTDKELLKSFLFKMPFGLFFLISAITLIFINAEWTDFGLLVSIQLSLWIVAYVAMIIGSKGNLFFLELMDLIIRYLLSLFSLGFPAYIIIQRRMNMEATVYES